MAEIIDLEAARRERQPHTSGPARCLGCGHTWHAVIPCGQDVVQCPACLTEKAVRDGLLFVDEPHWTCDKDGSQFLHIIPTGAYCPCCGTKWSWEQLQGVFGDG